MNTVKTYSDTRGTLMFPIKNNKHGNNIECNLKECTYSINHKNVFRGLHINTFSKIITCISGSFIDIIVNLDTYIPEYFTIKPGEQVYCPENYAHGFLSLEENSILSYFIDTEFDSEDGRLINYKDLFLNIKLPIPDSEIIINEKDSTSPYLQFDYFLLGSTGFIGKEILNSLKNQYKSVLCIKNRMNDLIGISKLIDFYKPAYLINAAGLTGVGNTKWCNENKRETLMTNVIEQIGIVNLCNDKEIHCTIIGSGAIYSDSKEIKTELSLGDLHSEYYSHTRILLESMIINFDNCLYLRVNYPISNNSNPKNLLSKLLNYSEIEDIELSISNLNSLMNIFPQMLENGEKGIFNFVSGNISLRKIIEYYSEHNTKIEKQFKCTERSGTLLSNDKIREYISETIDVGIIELVKNYK